MQIMQYLEEKISPYMSIVEKKLKMYELTICLRTLRKEHKNKLNKNIKKKQYE